MRGDYPRQLVFDSRLTTYPKLARLDRLGIAFITLRRPSPRRRKEIVLLPRSAWKVIELDVPTRKYRTPRVYEQTVRLGGGATFVSFLSRISATTSPPSCSPINAGSPPNSSSPVTPNAC